VNQKTLSFVNIIICLLCLLFVTAAVRLIPERGYDGYGDYNNTAAAHENEAHDEDWAFFLVNEQNPRPAELKSIGGGFSLDARCADYAEAMLFEAEKHGVRLRVTGTRSAGLGLDLLSVYCEADEMFEETPEFRWLTENSWRWGFIYQSGYFRFVGLLRAEQIFISGLTLEEYIEMCFFI